MSNKFKLESLQVQSFTTSLEKPEAKHLKGGTDIYRCGTGIDCQITVGGILCPQVPTGVVPYC